jgi:uncharacterized membrane protein
LNWLALLLILHLGGVALWLGGMVFALLLIREGTGLPEHGGRPVFRIAILHRLLALIWPVMPVTLASGWIMAGLAYGRPPLWPWALNAMQLTGLVMAGLFLLIRFGPYALMQEADAAGDRGETLMQCGRIGRLIALSCGAGMVGLVFGALLGY